MKVQVLCWGSNRSERPEMRTSTSVWHATVKERCLSPQSWPLSEVSHTKTHTRTAHLHPFSTWAALSSHVHTPDFSRRPRFPVLSVVDVTIEPCHTLPPQQAAVNCSFYSPSRVRPSVIWPQTGPASVRAEGRFSIPVCCNHCASQLKGVNLMYPASLEGNVSNVLLQHVMK